MNCFRFLLPLRLSIIIFTASAMAIFAQTPPLPTPMAPVTPVPAAPLPPPGIFGIGFTNITDTSARLAFTTSEPMSTTVVVLDQGKEFARLNQSDFAEIHDVDLPQLVKGTSYTVNITGTTHDGKTVNSNDHSLVPMLRPPSSHAWPGYTIFSTGVAGTFTPESLALLKQSGARMVRIEPSWDGLFPKGRQVNQVALDALVKRMADLKAQNVEPLVILDYCVPWAKTYTDHTMTWRNKAFGPPDNLDDWELYVRTLVTAMRGVTKYYEVWNEPDAGYLATGRYIERPDMPAPIARPPYKSNSDYWLGDRYVPMIERVRKVMDELQPDAIVMNGGWNRDYLGKSGDIVLEHGAGPYLDVYAYHCYSASPVSFSRWYDAIDGGFRTNIDRIFAENKVQLPLAITEWGWPAWTIPAAGKGFASFEDAQKFLVKSTFYFLSSQRYEVLSQFCLGIGPDTRDKDPLFFMLVNKSSDGKLVVQPTFKTFQWLATTFGSHPYQALPVEVTPSDRVKAYAIQMKETGDTYLAVWQDGISDAKGAITAQPARDADVSIAALTEGKYSVQTLDLNGQPGATPAVPVASPFHLKATLPEISSTAESGIYLVKITKSP